MQHCVVTCANDAVHYKQRDLFKKGNKNMSPTQIKKRSKKVDKAVWKIGKLVESLPLSQDGKGIELNTAVAERMSEYHMDMARAWQEHHFPKV